MNILRIYPFLPPLSGGMEKHIQRLTEEQRKLGHQITIAFNQGNITASEDIQILPSFKLRKVKSQSLRDLIFYFFLLIKIMQQKKRFDIVHVHGDWSAFLFGLLVARLTKPSKLVAGFHGVSSRGKWRYIYSFIFKKYSVIYATGVQDAVYFKTLTKTIVHSQHSGIDEVFLKIPESTANRLFDVVCVGSFVPIKNFDLIVDIAALMPKVTFLLIGDGVQKSLIESNCRNRAISNITFLGHLPPIGVAQQLRNAKIFLTTSFGEGTPTALLEAMACGLAVITSKSNDYDKLIKAGKNGYIVDGFQASNYVERIQMLLDNKNLLLEITHNNKQQTRSYGWPEVAKRITEWMVAI